MPVLLNSLFYIRLALYATGSVLHNNTPIANGTYIDIMGNSPSNAVEEPERRAPALREATDSTDQGVEHEEEAAYKYREYRCVSLTRETTGVCVSPAPVCC